MQTKRQQTLYRQRHTLPPGSTGVLLRGSHPRPQSVPTCTSEWDFIWKRCSQTGSETPDHLILSEVPLGSVTNVTGYRQTAEDGRVLPEAERGRLSPRDGHDPRRRRPSEATRKAFSRGSGQNLPRPMPAFWTSPSGGWRAKTGLQILPALSASCYDLRVTEDGIRGPLLKERWKIRT